MKKLMIQCVVLSCALWMGAGCDSKKQDQPPAEASKTAPAKPEAQAQEAADKVEDEVDGQWVESTTYALKFRVPEDWSVVTDEQGASATAPDGTTTVLLAGTKSQGLTTSMLNEIRADLKFRDLEIEKTGPAIINGMSVFRGQGSAVLEDPGMDQEIQFLGYTIKRRNDQLATLFIFSQAEMYEAQKEMIHGIAQTLVETSN